MAVVAGLIRARRNKTGPALPAARALPARLVGETCSGLNPIPERPLPAAIRRSGAMSLKPC
jgi:hypothetical protein